MTVPDICRTQETVMLSWMYWPHRAQETARSGGERREPTLSSGSRQTSKKTTNQVMELKLMEPEEFGNDPYNRIGPLSRARPKGSRIR
jgi:hypothetical protein